MTSREIIAGWDAYLSYPAYLSKKAKADLIARVSNDLGVKKIRSFGQGYSYAGCEIEVGKPDLMIFVINDNYHLGRGSWVELQYAVKHNIRVVFTWVGHRKYTRAVRTVEPKGLSHQYGSYRDYVKCKVSPNVISKLAIDGIITDWLTEMSKKKTFYDVDDAAKDGVDSGTLTITSPQKSSKVMANQRTGRTDRFVLNYYYLV